MKRTALSIVVALAATPLIALANPPGSGGTNGNGCLENCSGSNPGGAGGSGGSGGSSIASANPVSIAGASAATSANSSLSTSLAGTASASTSTASTSSTNVAGSRMLALTGGAVGAPANDTCVAYVSVGWGAITYPHTIDSCVALSEATFLIKMGLAAAALERACQLPSIAATSACPAVAK